MAIFIQISSMLKAVIGLLLMMGSANYASSQTAVDSVKLTIGNLFSAMRETNARGVLNCFTDSAVMQTIVRDAKGETMVKNEKLSEFAMIVGSMPKGAADERITFDMVKVDGALATAWTPYKFYFNGQFSHCGVNSFQLVRINGLWKIQYIIDTRRKQGCE